MAGLDSIVWENVDRLLAARGIGKSGLKQILHRNKNTYTNWFHEPRPSLKIKDLDDLATGLGVPPADLVTEGLGARASAKRIDVIFEANSLQATVEIESVQGGFVLRPGGRVRPSAVDNSQSEFPKPDTGEA